MATSVIKNSNPANYFGYGNTLRGKNIDELRPQNGGMFLYNGYGSSEVSGSVPFTDSYGILFCTENGYGGYFQFMLKVTNGKIYRRTYESGAWNAWTEST